MGLAGLVDKQIKLNRKPKSQNIDIEDNENCFTRTFLWKYRGGGIATAGRYQEAGCDEDICEKAGYESI